jgi:hypothetical protein
MVLGSDLREKMYLNWDGCVLNPTRDHVVSVLERRIRES